MSSENQITILLAEDHAVVRHGLLTLLETEPRFHVVGQAQTGREAVILAESLRPTVILMDIAMPVLNGLAATQQILAANSSAKILILSAHSDDEYIERMVEAGVAGFLEKQTSAEILTFAIHEIAGGKPFFSPAITKRMIAGRDQFLSRNGESKSSARNLSSRETEVLQLVAEGSANKQIAGHLGISIKTVEKHRQHLMDKLNIHETAGLTRYAIARGIIESSVQATITS